MAESADTRIQFRRGTANDWSTSNPTLGTGEPGYDTDNGTFKIGDGTNGWNALAGASDGYTTSYVVADITGVSGSKNDWNLESTSANLLKITPTGLLTITGITASYNYKKFTILNDSNSVNINLASSNSSSVAANRLVFTEGVGSIIYPGEKVDFVYDSVDNNWLVLKHGIPSNTRPIINKYNGAGSAVVSGVFNIVILNQDTYNNQTSKDPNTIYFVPE
jgi:hypothetical protein